MFKAFGPLMLVWDFALFCAEYMRLVLLLARCSQVTEHRSKKSRVMNHWAAPKESRTDGLCVTYLGTEHRGSGVWVHLQDILFSRGELGSPTQGTSCAEGVSSWEYIPLMTVGHSLGLGTFSDSSPKSSEVRGSHCL